MTTDDMSTPATRGELKQELATLEERFDAKLGLWGGALNAKIDALSIDLARHTQTILDSVRGMIAGLDDQYRDLPPRVAALEAAVFPAPPKRRRRG